jgi:fructokinase
MAAAGRAGPDRPEEGRGHRSRRPTRSQRQRAADDSGADGIVVVAGEALVDMVPAPVPGYFELAPGGSPANVAVGLARLGVRARLLARIADDMLGRRIREHLAGNAVELDHAVLATEQTSLALVAVGTDGGASYDFRVHGTADWHVDRGRAGGCAGRAGARRALGLARADHPAGRRRASGPAGPGRRDRHRQLRPELPADAHGCPGGRAGRGARGARRRRRGEGQRGGPGVAVPGAGPEAVVEDWLGRGPAIVAVTLGGDGVLGGTAGGVRSRRPGVPVTVIDTVGAGDTFSAALLAGLHRRGLLGAAARERLRAVSEESLDALLDEAATAAAITCSRRGGRPAHGRRGARPPGVTGSP